MAIQLPPLSSSRAGPLQRLGRRATQGAHYHETATYGPQKEDAGGRSRRPVGRRLPATAYPRKSDVNLSQRPIIYRPHPHPKLAGLWEFRAPSSDHQRPPPRKSGGETWTLSDARSPPGPEREELVRVSCSARGGRPFKHETVREHHAHGQQCLKDVKILPGDPRDPPPGAPRTASSTVGGLKGVGPLREKVPGRHHGRESCEICRTLGAVSGLIKPTRPRGEAPARSPSTGSRPRQGTAATHPRYPVRQGRGRPSRLWFDQLVGRPRREGGTPWTGGAGRLVTQDLVAPQDGRPYDLGRSPAPIVTHCFPPLVYSAGTWRADFRVKMFVPQFWSETHTHFVWESQMADRFSHKRPAATKSHILRARTLGTHAYVRTGGQGARTKK